eukprot:5893408-Pleurochrysis_carterae.AAC.3
MAKRGSVDRLPPTRVSLGRSFVPWTPPVQAALPYDLKQYRHWLSRGPIGRSGSPDQDHARLHLACTLPFYQQSLVKGAARARGWARLRGGFRAGARRGDVSHLRAVTRKSESGARALREYACDANAKLELYM